MSDGLKISEHIYSHTLFGDKCEFSGLGALTEFFSSVPQAVQERWPFDLSDKGYRTFYEQALIVSEQLGFVSRLHLRARITKGEETYAVSRKICFEDDKMVFVHDSLRREKARPEQILPICSRRVRGISCRPTIKPAKFATKTNIRKFLFRHVRRRKEKFRFTAVIFGPIKGSIFATKAIFPVFATGSKVFFPLMGWKLPTKT